MCQHIIASYYKVYIDINVIWLAENGNEFIMEWE